MKFIEVTPLRGNAKKMLINTQYIAYVAPYEREIRVAGQKAKKETVVSTVVCLSDITFYEVEEKFDDMVELLQDEG